MRSNLRYSVSLGLLVAAASSVAAVGCSSGGSGGDTGTAVAATVTRNLTPNVSSSDSTALVAGNTDFAFALYHGLSESSGGSTTGNLFFSPYSVSLALGMAYAGAHGETATQIAKALDFTLPASTLFPAIDKLDLAIQTVPSNATGADGAPFSLALADSLWGDQAVKFDQTFVNNLTQNFGAGLRTVDFVSAAGAAETAINNWVASETDDKIDPLLSPGQLDSSTRFVIVNAVYFNAGWATPFVAGQTQPGTFTRADGTKVQTPMMSADGGTATAYAKGTNYQAVELPYSGNTTSLIIVLPNAGAYADVEKALSGSLFDEVTSGLSSGEEIDLTMPSFKIHGGSVSLAPELQALGMTDAFTNAADFTSMIPAGGVYISDVVHQAFVDVDESGTVAAAATGVIGTADAVEESITVNVNSSFFFFIRDNASNTILFVGREDDPTATM